MFEQEIEKLNQLAKCWKCLDTSFIEMELADNFIYQSQWTLTPIVGKREYFSYLQKKFLAIRTAMETDLMTVKAVLVFYPSLQNRPGIVLTQTVNNVVRKVSLLIKIQENKITHIDVCFIPDPSEAILLE